ncbi:putative quinol monooxygenase [Alistipes indistinctus]|jgi:quinol monooxygenase YgiN|uniref:putative quinol monooxygenase n=1 Tax=Alistipes indistinctus TaxID=626932 RepID=UPI00266EE194|nr:putative quinol monooxygenase [Alistipes indistinctus]
MINIFVTINVTADKRAKVLELLAELAAASQKENGNLRYQYYLHPTDPAQIVICERWENAAVLAAHEATKHFTTLLPQIGDLASSVDIDKF